MDALRNEPSYLHVHSFPSGLEDKLEVRVEEDKLEVRVEEDQNPSVPRGKISSRAQSHLRAQPSLTQL
jgi:hypothetical protein